MVERGTCEPLAAEHSIMEKHWGEAELFQDTHEVPAGPGFSCQGLMEAESQILAALAVHYSGGTQTGRN